MNANKALHRTGIPLRSVAAGELGRWQGFGRACGLKGRNDDPVSRRTHPPLQGVGSAVVKPTSTAGHRTSGAGHATASLPRLPTSPHKPSRMPCSQYCSLMPTLSTRSPMTTARSSPTIRPSPRDSTPKATSPTPTIPGSADSTRTPTGSSGRTCPRAPISALSHLRRSAASWTGLTTGHGNVLASRLQISYSQELNHRLHLRVESAVVNRNRQK